MLAREGAHGQGTTTASAPAEVCESKKIHYTHTLPQQCPRTTWSSTSSTAQSVSVTTGTPSSVENNW